ncbi:MAG: hypothetical protein RL226_1627 [Bacteroidota bacterium]|jgi:transcription elongation GreA/GreB family factor
MKAKIISELRRKLEVRLDELNDELRSLKDSQADDEKSSAGDKYETGREMTQQEIDKIEVQMEMNLAHQSELKRLMSVDNTGMAGQGAVVKTSGGIYFLAFAFGKLEVDGTTVFVLSTESPVGALMVGRKPGDAFTFNMREFKIESVE